ncbi:MAG: methyltransferase [Candidatus Micrarchaeota archaeon]|nr:methyltransferase [Candidatus Micrarchaeota archaeon]
MDYNNLNIKTSRNVYEPSDDSFLAAMAIESAIPKIKGKRMSVLDMGSGSGILGLAAGTSGRVGKVTFADINPNAIRLSRKNYAINKKLIGASCSFVKTDLFSKIKASFDLIIFNAPYLPDDENTNNRVLNRAFSGGEEGIEVCIRFLSKLGPHLSRDGKALMVVSSFGNLKKLRATAREVGLQMKTVAKKHIFFEDILVLEVSRAPQK